MDTQFSNVNREITSELIFAAVIYNNHFHF